MARPPKPLIGYWRIVEMARWDDDEFDASGHAHVVIDADGLGEFRFCGLEGWFDAGGDGVTPSLRFDWEGEGPGGKRRGRGSVALDAKGRLTGWLEAAGGEREAFTAKRQEPPSRRYQTGPLRR